MAFLYILLGKNNRYYIGSTNNLDRRLEEHNGGKAKYTSEILPVKLVFSQEFPSLLQARRAENWFKKQKSSHLIKRIILEGKIEKTFD